MTQKVLFTGSRAASPDMLAVTRRYIETRLAGKDVEVVVGDAEGVDYCVVQTCDELEIPVQVHGAYNKMRYTTWTGQNVIHDTDYPGRDRIMASLIRPDDRAVVVWNGITKRCGTYLTANAVSKNTLLVYWLWKKPE